MLPGVIVGYDPGGNDAHGVAKLRVESGKAVALATQTLETGEQVIALLEQLPDLMGLGLDSLSCWSTGGGGWRPADRWLRQRYKDLQNSVMTPNGLAGSMGPSGMAVLIAARKYDYQANRADMDATLTRLLSVPVAPANDDEWDAAPKRTSGSSRRAEVRITLGRSERVVVEQAQRMKLTAHSCGHARQQAAAAYAHR